MNEKVFIAQNDLSAALKRLSEKIEVWVPAPAAKGVWTTEFQPLQEGVAPALDRQTTQPPKNALLPQAETLLRYEYTKDPEDASKVSLRLDDTLDVKPLLVFGTRPCDVRGFIVFDRVFLEGPHVDVYYKKRRENTLFATLVCRDNDSACFCSAVGSGPADQAGSDFWVTPVSGGFVVEALSEGAAPFLPILGGAATEEKIAEARAIQEEAASRRVGDLDVSGAPDAQFKRFQEMDFWRDEVSQCLSCGVCTYVCPTCYCFTITDEAKGLKGERIRSWDSCMFCQYTQEASGHNPRPTKLERYRNRLGHKFSYYPKKFDGMFACCGCGRCIRACPVSIDIRKIVQHVEETKDACQCA